MRNSYLKTGKLICEFIDAYEAITSQSGQPIWSEITDHLTQIGHVTKQGGSWRQSSAQHALVRYCEQTNIDYPLRQRRGAANNPKTNEITITLKITLPAGQKINVVVE